MNIDFTGKTVLVTGAGHGCGRAIAHAYLANGARVFACDVTTDALAETHRLHPGLGTLVLDVGDRDAVQAAISALPASADILVNNAGGVRGQVGRPIEEVSAAEWQSIFDVNVSGAFFMSQAVAPGMKARLWGRVSIIS